MPVREVAGTKVDQVIVGSSVNSSFRDLMTVCRIVEGRRVAPGVHFHVNPGSRQVLENVAQQGGVLMLLMAGVSIHQSGCLGCIGMGQAPGTESGLVCAPSRATSPAEAAPRTTRSISVPRRQPLHRGWQA